MSLSLLPVLQSIRWPCSAVIPPLVTSPFAAEAGYVDVTGFPPATAVEDPYTGKIFLTP